MQAIRRAAREQLDLAELHDRAQLRLGASGRGRLVGLLGPRRLGVGALAEEVEGAPLQFERLKPRPDPSRRAIVEQLSAYASARSASPATSAARPAAMMMSGDVSPAVDRVAR